MKMIDFLSIAQACVVIGWFWLIVYTFHRAEDFKKRYFSVILTIYFIQGVLKVAELLQYENDHEVLSTLSIVSNVLCIFGFTFLTDRYIKFKNYFDEKKHLTNINDNSFRNVMRGTESQKG